MRMPPTKLLSAPCMARLMATPAEASSVTKLVSGMPITLAAVRITTMYKSSLSRFSKKPFSVASIFIFASKRSKSFITQ